ncbi:MAG TPA: LCP family protein [Solirubrobacteraceae bacterium]|nr:LCP family protein [Solirubrobacteraceae bacterium]
MSKDPDENDYRVYRSGGSTHAARRPRPEAERPAARERADAREDPAVHVDEAGYRVYRSQPRGLSARLRGESDPDAGRRIEAAERAGSARRESRRDAEAGGAGFGALDGRRSGPGGRWRGPGGRRGRVSALTGPRPRGLGRWGRGTWTVRRGLKYVVSLAVAWVLLSAVLFMISASEKAGNIPAALSAALTKTSAPMLVSPQTVLVLGLDNRPTTGYSAHEGGANHNEAAANTDTIMLWRVGGGVSRRLSIPRDTLVNIPGLGEAKINAAWSQNPGLTVKVVEALTGVKINHVIIVDLGNFPKFIDDIGGVTVTTPRICSNISGGVKNGGYTLYLRPGTHHLTGTQALTLARTRDNACNLAYNDINREKMQQVVLNGIKSQLFSLHAFLHLPWASWDAPGVIQTDMGGTTLLQLFASAELGGSSKPQTLNEANQVYNGQDVLIPSTADIRAKVHQLLNG